MRQVRLLGGGPGGRRWLRCRRSRRVPRQRADGAGADPGNPRSRRGGGI